MKKIEDCLDTHGINFLKDYPTVTTNRIEKVELVKQRTWYLKKVVLASIHFKNGTSLKLENNASNVVFVVSDKEYSYAKYKLKNSKKTSDDVMEIYLNEADYLSLKDFFVKEVKDILVNYTSKLVENVYIM